MLCPVCKRDYLLQGAPPSGSIFCACGFRLDTGGDRLGLEHLKQQLADTYSQHRRAGPVVLACRSSSCAAGAAIAICFNRKATTMLRVFAMATSTFVSKAFYAPSYSRVCGMQVDNLLRERLLYQAKFYRFVSTPRFGRSSELVQGFAVCCSLRRTHLVPTPRRAVCYFLSLQLFLPQRYLQRRAYVCGGGCSGLGRLVELMRRLWLRKSSDVTQRARCCCRYVCGSCPSHEALWLRKQVRDKLCNPLDRFG